MKKEYLRRPSGDSGTTSLRRVLSTAPLEIDLNRSSTRFHCLQLQEPDLVFGGGHLSVDPKTGLAARGPYGVSRPGDTRQIRVGIVGTPEGTDNILKLLQELSKPIEQTEKFDCVLYPSFPGINSLEPFRIHLLTQSQWHRPLYKRDFRAIEDCKDSGTRRWLLQEMFGGEVRALSELENPPQVVICAVSENMPLLAGMAAASAVAYSAPHGEPLLGDAEHGSNRSLQEFHGGFKAECMGSLPTELVWDHAIPKIGGMRDRATQAWNISSRLLYRASVIPWRLSSASAESCFVGISFYRPLHRASPQSARSFAQVVTEFGDHFIVDGEDLAGNPGNEGDDALHMNEPSAGQLLSRALAVFKKQTGTSPHKVVVHKTAPYSNAERAGFETALCNIPEHGLMTITRRGIFCLRPGSKPILRGTVIPFDERVGLVFTSGYVPFMRASTTNRIPQPLEITENWGSITFLQAAQDLNRLTKLDLISADFCADLPVTLGRSQEIASVLRALGRKEPSLDYRYYV